MHNYIKVQLQVNEFTFLQSLYEEGCRYIVAWPSNNIPEFLLGLGLMNIQEAEPPHEKYFTVGWIPGVKVRFVTQYGDYFMLLPVE